MHTYVVEYLNENEFNKKTRALKKYNMLAYKKLIFDCVPKLRDGNMQGVIVSKNSKEGIIKYEFKLPTDRMFSQVHGDVVLHYTLYENQKIIMLDTITPEEILSEGHQKELQTYKGVMISKSHAERDMFKINLLNSMNKNGFLSNNHINLSIKIKKHVLITCFLYFTHIISIFIWITRINIIYK